MTEFSEQRYNARLAELFQLHRSVQTAGFGQNSYKPGLDGMRRFDAALGHPASRLRCVHVAGTNGKGSVCSMVAASLAASGLKVGLYTSPHLFDFRERAKIVQGDSCSMIPKEYVWSFLEKYGPALEGLSFFEITTGLALKWFDDEGVDIAVMEVGLGGRLDSTNIVNPDVAVVVSIGLDHCALLGDTRAQIAAEKAGIFKPGVPAVVGLRDDETAPVFERIAAEVHCPLFFASEETSDIQEMNAATARLALEILGEPADEAALRDYKRITGLHGRWEMLSEKPETICDIGHNPPALEVNFSRLESLGRPLVIVYGIMADKDLDGIAPLMPGSAKFVLVAPHTERALGVESLGERLAALRPDLDLQLASSVSEGVTLALEMASDIPGSLVYIGGSTFVVAEAATMFTKNSIL